MLDKDQLMICNLRKVGSRVGVLLQTALEILEFYFIQEVWLTMCSGEPSFFRIVIILEFFFFLLKQRTYRKMWISKIGIFSFNMLRVLDIMSTTPLLP